MLNDKKQPYFKSSPICYISKEYEEMVNDFCNKYIEFIKNFSEIKEHNNNTNILSLEQQKLGLACIDLFSHKRTNFTMKFTSKLLDYSNKLTKIEVLESTNKYYNLVDMTDTVDNIHKLYLENKHKNPIIINNITKNITNRKTYNIGFLKKYIEKSEYEKEQKIKKEKLKNEKNRKEKERLREIKIKNILQKTIDVEHERIKKEKERFIREKLDKEPKEERTKRLEIEDEESRVYYSDDYDSDFIYHKGGYIYDPKSEDSADEFNKY